METGTFYPDRYHIPVCLILVFCTLHSWSAWSFFICQIPRGGNCLLSPVTGYAHGCTLRLYSPTYYSDPVSSSNMPCKLKDSCTCCRRDRQYPYNSKNGMNNCFLSMIILSSFGVFMSLLCTCPQQIKFNSFLLWELCKRRLAKLVKAERYPAPVFPSSLHNANQQNSCIRR